MQQRGLAELRDQRLVAVDQLEHQEVGDLADPGAAGLRQTGRQGLAALVQHPVQVAQVRGEQLVAAAMQHRRNVGGIEHELVVGPALDHPAQADRRHALARVAGQHDAQVHPADLDRRHALPAHVGVADLDLGAAKSGRHRTGVGLCIGLGDARALQRDGEHDELVACVDGTSRAAGAGSCPGTSNASPSGITPCAAVIAILPRFSAALSSVRDTYPQP
jgi:hypothetical protein